MSPSNYTGKYEKVGDDKGLRMKAEKGPGDRRMFLVGGCKLFAGHSFGLPGSLLEPNNVLQLYGYELFTEEIFSQ